MFLLPEPRKRLRPKFWILKAEYEKYMGNSDKAGGGKSHSRSGERHGEADQSQGAQNGKGRVRLRGRAEKCDYAGNARFYGRWQGKREGGVQGAERGAAEAFQDQSEKGSRVVGRRAQSEKAAERRGKVQAAETGHVQAMAQVAFLDAGEERECHSCVSQRQRE